MPLADPQQLAPLPPTSRSNSVRSCWGACLAPPVGVLLQHVAVGCSVSPKTDTQGQALFTEK